MPLMQNLQLRAIDTLGMLENDQREIVDVKAWVTLVQIISDFE